MGWRRELGKAGGLFRDEQKKKLGAPSERDEPERAEEVELINSRLS